MRAVRGDEIAMIFQEPMTSLNPAFTVGNQIAETVRAHRDVPGQRPGAGPSRCSTWSASRTPGARVDEYPHNFSGGMRQRVMIAMALACDPQAADRRRAHDALDVTIQAQILDLLRELQDELGMAMLFVTHDLGVVADICDRVASCTPGRSVEQAVDDLFDRPRHPYTEGLLRATPQSTGRRRPAARHRGDRPGPDAMPAGCRFRPRCSHAIDRCTEVPVLEPTAGGGLARCVRNQELHLGARS